MDFKVFSQEDKPILIDFMADWCGSCQTMDPVLDRLREHMGDEISIIKVDVDENPLVVSSFNILNIPTFVLIQKGKVLWRYTGISTERALAENIRRYLT